MHNSTSTQNVLKVSSLVTEYLYATHFEYILSTCPVMHTKIEYFILDRPYRYRALSVLRLQCSQFAVGHCGV